MQVFDLKGALVTAFRRHASEHEDGGDDEINLAGLEGTPAALTRKSM